MKNGITNFCYAKFLKIFAKSYNKTYSLNEAQDGLRNSFRLGAHLAQKMTTAHPSRHLKHNPALSLKFKEILRHMFLFGISSRTKSVYSVINSAVDDYRQDTLTVMGRVGVTTYSDYAPKLTMGISLPPNKESINYRLKRD